MSYKTSPCPKCRAQIVHSSYNFKAGILSDAVFCDNCEEWFENVMTNHVFTEEDVKFMRQTFHEKN